MLDRNSARVGETFCFIDKETTDRRKTSSAMRACLGDTPDFASSENHFTAGVDATYFWSHTSAGLSVPFFLMR